MMSAMKPQQMQARRTQQRAASGRRAAFSARKPCVVVRAAAADKEQVRTVLAIWFSPGPRNQQLCVLTLPLDRAPRAQARVAPGPAAMAAMLTLSTMLTLSPIARADDTPEVVSTG